MFGFGWGSGKKRGLRTWVLLMLRQSAKTGAEIMDEMESMSQGWWRPSPGSIYPLLEDLVKEGVLQKRPDGRYELSPGAREEVGWPFGMPSRGPQKVEDILREMNAFVSYLEDRRQADASVLGAHRDELQAIIQRLSSLSP